MAKLPKVRLLVEQLEDRTLPAGNVVLYLLTRTRARLATKQCSSPGTTWATTLSWLWYRYSKATTTQTRILPTINYHPWRSLVVRF
jgi:hypothetical protein